MPKRFTRKKAEEALEAAERLFELLDEDERSPLGKELNTIFLFLEAACREMPEQAN